MRSYTAMLARMPSRHGEDLGTKKGVGRCVSRYVHGMIRQAFNRENIICEGVQGRSGVPGGGAGAEPPARSYTGSGAQRSEVGAERPNLRRAEPPADPAQRLRANAQVRGDQVLREAPDDLGPPLDQRAVAALAVLAEGLGEPAL